MTEQIVEKKNKSTYDDPEFKKKHKEYILTKVECPCGTTTARCNMSHHRKTKKHLKWINSNDKLIDEIILDSEHITKSIKKLKKKLKSYKNNVK